MSKTELLVALVCIAGSLLCCNADTSCKIMVEEATGENYLYDVTDLGDLTAKFHGFTYSINLCNTVTSSCPEGTAICRTLSSANNNNRTNAQFTSLGKLATRDVTPYGFNPPQPGIGFVAMFGEGDACSDDDNYVSAVIVSCDPNQRAMIAVTSDSDCYVEFSVTSKFGCGHLPTSSEEEGSEGDSGDLVALVILIILAVCVVVYFVGGAVYQKVVKDASSPKEMIIHNEFWCSLPSLVIDGCKFIGHGFKRGDYITV